MVWHWLYTVGHIHTLVWLATIGNLTNGTFNMNDSLTWCIHCTITCKHVGYFILNICVLNLWKIDTFLKHIKLTLQTTTLNTLSFAVTNNTMWTLKLKITEKLPSVVFTKRIHNAVFSIKSLGFQNCRTILRGYWFSCSFPNDTEHTGNFSKHPCQRFGKILPIIICN